jgi:hypothetical protein
MEWQPIETAPRDGSEVFAWMRGSLVPVAVYFVSREYLEEEYGDPYYMEAGWYYSLGYPFDDALPEYPLDDYLTHWMPLPDPPKG